MELFLLAKAIQIPGLNRRRRVWTFLPLSYYEYNPTVDIRFCISTMARMYLAVIAPELYPLIRWVGRHFPMRVYSLAGTTKAGRAAKRTEYAHQTLLEAGFEADCLLLAIRPEGFHGEPFWQQEFADWYRWWATGIAQ
jgi:hypothetical protein